MLQEKKYIRKDNILMKMHALLQKIKHVETINIT